MKGPMKDDGITIPIVRPGHLPIKAVYESTPQSRHSESAIYYKVFEIIYSLPVTFRPPLTLYTYVRTGCVVYINHIKLFFKHHNIVRYRKVQFTGFLRKTVFVLGKRTCGYRLTWRRITESEKHVSVALHKIYIFTHFDTSSFFFQLPDSIFSSHKSPPFLNHPIKLSYRWSTILKLHPVPQIYYGMWLDR